MITLNAKPNLMDVFFFIGLLVVVYFAITIPLKWLVDWIFGTQDYTKNSEEHKDIERYIN